MGEARGCLPGIIAIVSLSIVGHNASNAEGTTGRRPLSAIPSFAGVDACNNFISCYVGHVRFRFRRK